MRGVITSDGYDNYIVMVMMILEDVDKMMVMVTVVVQKLDRMMVMVKLAKPIEKNGDNNSWNIGLIESDVMCQPRKIPLYA